MRYTTGLGCVAMASSLLVACASPDVVCDFGDDGSDGRWRAERRHTGTVALPPGLTSMTRRFRVTVSGLSEIGTSHAALGPSFVTLDGAVSYGPSLPANAELPEVELRVQALRPDGSAGAGGRWRSDPWEERVQDIFTCNGAPEDGCCEWGAPACSVVVELRIARYDVLFPEVNVEWVATFSAEFPHCRGEPRPTLSVEELSP